VRSLALLLLVACGQPAKRDTTAPAPVTAPMAHDPTCPLEVPGTSITVEDTPDGAAMVFVTTGDAAAVQAAADAFAAAHPSATSGFAGMVAKSANVTAQRITGGAKLVFSGGDAPAIQSELRMHAGHLSAGSCEMAM
jgi:hypothetical protein